MIRSDAELRQYWPKLLREEHKAVFPRSRRQRGGRGMVLRRAPADGRAHAATAHLGPPPDKDDRSVAERLAAVLYLPMDEAERDQEEAAIKAWFEASGCH